MASGVRDEVDVATVVLGLTLLDEAEVELTGAGVTTVLLLPAH